MKKISVIIPTYNEEKDISECLESLKKQSYKNFEIIIVDDGSKDNTMNVLKKFKTKIIKGKHKGPGFSRNLGAKKAKGSILVFVDADMTFDKDYIRNLIQPMKNKKIIGTTHDYEEARNINNIWSKCWGKIRIAKGSRHNVIFRAIRKNKFLELGGFDPKYGYADDQTFFLRYNIAPKVAKNTTCYHKNPESLKQVFKQSRWIGASIRNKLINNPISPIFLILLSPIAIPLLSIRKCYVNRCWNLFFPMLVFMIVRYFGSIFGLLRKNYLGSNTR